MNDKPKILIVDDNPGSIDFLMETLNAYDVSVVIDGRSALEMIEEEKPDLILLDINMPGIDGFKTCSLIKSNQSTMDIPVVFLTGKTDTESVIRAFDVGGVDYITKPYRPKEVLVRIQTQIKLKKAMEELEKIAREDPMTGIANRRRFFEVANPLFDDAKKQGVSFYLFVFDLDNFKAINDTYGHDVGDEVIKAFVAAVQAHLDKNDCFARVGGDEFILVLYGMKKEEAIAKIDRIRKTVSKTRVSKMQISFAVSIGAAKLKPDDISIDAVFKRADNGLYKAKRISRESTRGQA